MTISATTAAAIQRPRPLRSVVGVVFISCTTDVGVPRFVGQNTYMNGPPLARRTPTVIDSLGAPAASRTGRDREPGFPGAPADHDHLGGERDGEHQRDRRGGRGEGGTDDRRGGDDDDACHEQASHPAIVAHVARSHSSPSRSNINRAPTNDAERNGGNGAESEQPGRRCGDRWCFDVPFKITAPVDPEPDREDQRALLEPIAAELADDEEHDNRQAPDNVQRVSHFTEPPRPRSPAHILAQGPAPLASSSRLRQRTSRPAGQTSLQYAQEGSNLADPMVPWGGHMRILATLAILVAAMTVAGAPSDAATAAPDPCGLRGATPATYAHVVVIMEENLSYKNAIGSVKAPYLNQLAGECALATDFHNETHGSQPNYMAATSGVATATGAHSSAASIFQQVPSWQELEESMGKNCGGVNLAYKHGATPPTGTPRSPPRASSSTCRWRPPTPAPRPRPRPPSRSSRRAAAMTITGRRAARAAGR